MLYLFELLNKVYLNEISKSNYQGAYIQVGAIKGSFCISSLFGGRGTGTWRSPLSDVHPVRNSTKLLV